jgi:hypothetical protein
MEQHWYQCLQYPILNTPILHALALLLSGMTVAAVLSASDLTRLVEMGPREWLKFSPGFLMPLLILAYACATMECALSSALSGQGPGLYWPGWRAGLALKSGLRWALSFLAGPLLLVIVAGYYWLYGGDLRVLDWIIVGELCVLAVAYWLLLVVSTNERDSLLAANPVRVSRLIHRLGLRAAVPLLVVPALVFAHAVVGFFAAEKLHDSIFLGWLLLAGCWWSAFFCAQFVLRLLGVWCYRAPAAGGGP